jgi:hypothetical protein
MTEWLLLVLLVPGIVVPVVLLCGFAGCNAIYGLEPTVPIKPGPVIDSISQTVSAITLTWMVDQGATSIAFERMKLDEMGHPVGASQSLPVVALDVTLPPTTVRDDDGLEASTTYRYTARAVYAGEWSEESHKDVRTLDAPTFDAKGGDGSPRTGNGSVATTWSHTASGDSRAVLVGLRWAHNAFLPSGAAPTRTVTYGGASMTSLGVLGLDHADPTAASGTYTEFFYLLSPLTGARTVSLTVLRPFATITIIGCSLSYVEVSQVGSAPASVAGAEAGTSLSQTVSSAVNETIVQMFNTQSGLITGYDQTVRFDDQANGIGFVIGDAKGDTAVPFKASRAAGVQYAGLAVRLMPIS